MVGTWVRVMTVDMIGKKKKKDLREESVVGTTERKTFERLFSKAFS